MNIVVIDEDNETWSEFNNNVGYVILDAKIDKHYRPKSKSGRKISIQELVDTYLTLEKVRDELYE